MPEDDKLVCAAHIMDTIQLIMRNIHSEMDKTSGVFMSVQQFRAISIILDSQMPSLSYVAERLGTTLSSASRMIEALVERGYVLREADAEDRRKLVLGVTKEGKSAMEEVENIAISTMALKLSSFTGSERAVITLAMDLIRGAFSNKGVSESLSLIQT